LIAAYDTLAQGCAYEEVVAAIVAAGGPVDGGTRAEAVRLHDDKARAPPRAARCDAHTPRGAQACAAVQEGSPGQTEHLAPPP
jgi:hypothetical protein